MSVWDLTEEEAVLLKSIAEVKRYPVVRFELRSSKDAELCSYALTNVHLESADEGMESVKARGEVLQRLGDAGYVDIDMRPQILVSSDYALYFKSTLYAQLKELVKEGQNRPGFLFDTPHMKKGRVYLNPKGERWLSRKNDSAHE